MRIKHLHRAVQAMAGVALEDIQDGKLFLEHEKEIYVRLADMSVLSNAAKVERQLQYKIDLPKTAENVAKGGIRVRRITDVAFNPDSQRGEDKGDRAEYVETLKAVLGPGKRLEVPNPSSKDAFELFSYLCGSAMYKDRYSFPITGTDLVFEVDMFIMPDGSYAPVAKIDLEMKEEIEIPPLPFEVTEMILGDSKDSDEQAKIRSYYGRYFITPNPHVKKEEDPGDHEYRGDYVSDSAKIPA